MNPWLVAAIAAGALWLLMGRGNALPMAATSDTTQPLTDPRGTGGDTSATTLPPGTVHGADVGSMVSVKSSEPVGDTSTSSAPYGGPYVNTSAVQQAAASFGASPSASTVNAVAGQAAFTQTAAATFPTWTQAAGKQPYNTAG